ncbi:MAG: DUF3124 domain-containing protein [Bacteroidales bacterium]|nr:DUF3124 domain-containing protein [Bacteroidales bacterium]
MKAIYILIAVVFMGCSTNGSKSENEKKKSHPSHKYTFVDKDSAELNHIQTEYLPVYSDIYHQDGTRRFMLATTISIRNNSLTDSAYIFGATYYDSYGKMISEFIDSTLLLIPLESIEFVVNEKDQTGGAGANFIISWGSNHFSDQLLIQSVMIGTYGQQGISFVTDSKVINQ